MRSCHGLVFLLLALVSSACSAPVEADAELGVPEAVAVDLDEALATGALEDSAAPVELVAFAPGPYLVHDAAVDLDAALGSIEVLGASDDIVSARRPLLAPAPALADRLGEHVTLLGAAGERCTAQLAAPYALYQAESWDLFGDPSEVDDGQVGRRLVRDRSPILVSELTVLDGECAGTRVGFRADRPEPQAFVRAELGAVSSAEAIAAFRGLPVWNDLQVEYESFSSPDGIIAEGDWDGYEGTGPDVRVLADDKGQQRVIVQAQVGAGCGDFSGMLWAVFALREGVLVPRAWQRSYDVPDLLLEGSGFMPQAFIGPRWAVLPTHSGYRSVHAEVPVFTCPC